ncbi:MAG: acetyl-CoA carboxylase biotin carboxyl carrier protein [Pirellulaceae bacterium]|nr:acetyl-CoA carboxylase biotin carboxyl carrier protein [Pirellulaceae bacterium]
MSESDIKPESEDSVFEVQRIRRLVELMKEHDLSEIDLRESRHRIRICRGPKEAPRAAYAPPPPVAAPQAAAASAGMTPSADSPNTMIIKSPMVGTYYSKPNPKAESFVKVGSKVDVNTPICIIEAMKVFNEIPAEIRGTITAILVEDGEAVEFDKPLFKVEKS